VKMPVGAVAIFGGVTSALHFDGVNVFGIELRTHVRAMLGVRHGHAVQQPGNLMSAADVELVVTMYAPGT